jgi:GT2 family glycosyltransferase
MAEQLEKDAFRGIVGTLLRYPDDRIQHEGISFFREGPLRGLCYHPGHRQRLEPPRTGTAVSTPAVTGACMMIKSALFQRLDGFDEEYAEECQDVDLCLAARRLGFSTHLVYPGRVVHLENATRPKDSEEWPDRQRFVRKWGAFVEAFDL